MDRADVRSLCLSSIVVAGFVSWSLVAANSQVAMRRREVAEFDRKRAERQASDAKERWPSADEPAAAYPGDVAPSGLVVRADGSPVEGASVQLGHGYRGSVGVDVSVAQVSRSGPDGRFPLDAAPDLDFAFLDVRGPGLVRASGVVSYRRGLQTRVVMVPPRAVRVRVTAAGGERPVPGAQVTSFTGPVAGSPASSLLWPPVDSATTDSDGRAVVGSAGGDTSIRVEVPGFAPVQTGVFEVPHTGVDRSAALSSGARIEGAVFAPVGSVVAGATVVAFSWLGYRRSVVTDRDGRFAFDDVPPGVEAVGRRGPYSQSSVPLLVVRAVGFPDTQKDVGTVTAGSVRRVAVVLEGGRVVAGSVRRQDGSPVAGVAIVRGGRESVEFDLFPERRTAYTDSSGSFRFVSAFGLVSLVISDPLLGLERKETVRVDPAGPPPRLDLVLDEPRAPLSVRVLDAEGRPLAGIAVLATRSGRRITDGDGRVSFPAVPRGRVTVRAERTGFAPCWRHVDMGAAPVGDATFRFATGSVAGRVVHPDGRPACVALDVEPASRGDDEPKDAGRSAARVVSASDGSFHADGLGSGRCSISSGEPTAQLLERYSSVSAGIGATDVRVMVAYPWEGGALRPFVEVVDAGTGAAIVSSVRVRLLAADPDATAPDDAWFAFEEKASGTWRLGEPVKPGVYGVSVEAKGYASEARRDLTIAAGDVPPHWRIALERGGARRDRR